MFDHPLKRKIFWKRIVLLGVVLFLTLLTPTFLPLLSLIGINLPLLPWYIVGPAAFCAMGGEIGFAMKVLKIDFWQSYSDEYAVYYLHYTKQQVLWHHLATYPWIEYISNPLLEEAEQDIENSPLDQLFGKGFLITGLPGAGKSTAILRIVKCLQERMRHEYSFLRRLPSPYHPKVVVVHQPVKLAMSVGMVKLPRFSEPTIIIVDDLHNLSTEQMKVMTETLKSYLTEKAIVLCATRSPEADNLPQLFQRFHPIDCTTSTPFPKTYRDFLVKLISASARKFQIQMNSQILEALVSKALSNNQPPLYIVDLFRYLHEKVGIRRLSQKYIDKIPPELERIHQIYWNDIKGNQTYADFLRTILLLKILRAPITENNIEMIYSEVFGHKTEFEHAVTNLQESIWFTISETGIVAPDPPYKAVMFPSISKRIEHFWQLIKEQVITDREAKDLVAHIAFYFSSVLNDIDYIQNLFREMEEYTKGSPAAQLAVWLAFAIAFVRLGEIDEAINALQKAKELDSEISFSAFVSLGVLCYSREEFENAKILLQKAIEFEPERAIVWGILGDVFLAMKEFEEAEGKYQKAVNLDPTEVGYWRGLGGARLNSGKVEEAKEAFQKAVDLDPKDTISWHGLADSSYQLEKFEEAEEALQKAADLDPKDAFRWQFLGLIRIKLKKFEKAEEALQKAADLDPTEKTLWVLLGSVQAKLGKLEEMEKTYQKMLDLDPTDAFQMRILGMAEFLMEKYEKAKETLETAVRIDPKDIEGWDFLLLVYEFLGEQEAAQRCKSKIDALRKQKDVRE